MGGPSGPEDIARRRRWPTMRCEMRCAGNPNSRGLEIEHAGVCSRLCGLASAKARGGWRRGRGVGQSSVTRLSLYAAILPRSRAEALTQPPLFQAPLPQRRVPPLAQRELHSYAHSEPKSQLSERWSGGTSLFSPAQASDPGGLRSSLESAEYPGPSVPARLIAKKRRQRRTPPAARRRAHRPT
jgi:hypothetical protein